MIRKVYNQFIERDENNITKLTTTVEEYNSYSEDDEFGNDRIILFDYETSDYVRKDR